MKSRPATPKKTQPVTHGDQVPLRETTLADIEQRLLREFRNRGKIPAEIDISGFPELDWRGVSFCLGFAGEAAKAGEKAVIVAAPAQAEILLSLGIHRYAEIREPRP